MLLLWHFHDRSIFSLNLPRIQTSTGAFMTNQKQGLFLTDVIIAPEG